MSVPLMSSLQQLRQQAAAELAQSARLRLGLLMVMAILWLWALLVLGDMAQAWRESAEQLQDKAAALRPVLKERIWLERAEDSSEQLQAVRTQLWSDPDLAVTEANLQDWLRGTAQKAGLTVRDLNVTRGSLEKPSAPLQGLTPVTARLVLDYNRLPMLAYLAELARREPLLLVDRLALRLGAQPVLAELDVRVLAATQSPDATSAVPGEAAASQSLVAASGLASAATPAAKPASSASSAAKSAAKSVTTSASTPAAIPSKSKQPGAKP